MYKFNFDAHSDIFTDVTQRRDRGHTGILRNFHKQRLEKGGIGGGIYVIWNDPPYADEDPYGRTLQMMEAIRQEEEASRDFITIARSSAEVEQAVREEKRFMIIGLEGVKSIGTDIDKLNEFYDFGARHCSLTWNEKNQLAAGAFAPEEYGLTEAGRKAVRRIEELGMILDVSHLNRHSFWDLMDEARGPVVATHSNCDALCCYERNLTDDQLRAIAQTGGVVGLNSFNAMTDRDPGRQDLPRLVDHLDHMVEVMGIDHVGFGFDFCGYLEKDTTAAFSPGPVEIRGLEDESKVPEFVEEIRRRGYSDEDMDKICFGNWMRIVREVI